MKLGQHSDAVTWFCLWFLTVTLGISWAADYGKTNWIPEVTNGWASSYHTHWTLPGKESMEVVTNVVETSDEGGCPTCDQLRKNPGILIYHEAWGCKPYRPATWKLTTTTVKEVWTLKYTWRDREWTQTDEKVLSKSYKKVTKQASWAEAPVTEADTNSVRYEFGGQSYWFVPGNTMTGSIALTNLYVGTNMIMTITNPIWRTYINYE